MPVPAPPSPVYAALRRQCCGTGIRALHPVARVSQAMVWSVRPPIVTVTPGASLAPNKRKKAAHIGGAARHRSTNDALLSRALQPGSRRDRLRPDQHGGAARDGDGFE